MCKCFKSCLKFCKPSFWKKKLCGPEKEITVALFPLVVLIFVWPIIGMVRTFVFTEVEHPYPMTITIIAQLFIFGVGLLPQLKQMKKRGIKLKSPKNPATAKKPNPVTPLVCVKKFIHWAIYPALFLAIFLYAEFSISAICPDNPNLCLLFTRPPLFLFVLVMLAAAKAGRRGGRLDWLVACIMFAGVGLLFWNEEAGCHLDSRADFQVVLAGVLTMISFGAFPVMVRKATLTSGICKIMWVMAFWNIIFLLPLALVFEGNQAWSLNSQTGPFVAFLAGMTVIWIWALVVALSHSETIAVGLALHIGLVMGDVGIHEYIRNGYTMGTLQIIGLLFVAIAFVWFIKRVVVLGYHKKAKLKEQKNNPNGDVVIDIPKKSNQTGGYPPKPSGNENTKLSKKDKKGKNQNYHTVNVPANPTPTRPRREQHSSEQQAARYSGSEGAPLGGPIYAPPQVFTHPPSHYTHSGSESDYESFTGSASESGSGKPKKEGAKKTRLKKALKKTVDKL